MKLYHYAPKENTVMRDGLFSISKIDRNLRAYAHRAVSENKEDILKWLDSTFYGRSRAISCLTEQIKWKGNDPVLKKIVDGTMLFSFELNDLYIQDNYNISNIEEKKQDILNTIPINRGIVILNWLSCMTFVILPIAVFCCMYSR